MRRRSAPAAAGLLTLALVLAGCNSQSVTPASVDEPLAAASEAPPVLGREALRQPLGLVPAAVPTDTPSATASAAPKPTKPPAPSYDVAAVQRTLTDLKYYVGPIDGKSGPAVKNAVMAFQKVQGIGVDGGVGAGTLAALAAPKQPSLQGSSPSNRVEVDLSKQVLYVVKGGAVERIMPVSSGNGATYKQKDGSTARALTPTGYYKIQRRIVGERKADLGTLYDPQYFYRGWAIHGSNSVPAGPASHGCIRVPRADGKWLLKKINNGMSVYLYGGKHTFSAGSSAPGTDSPTGDGAATTAESTAPAPATQEPSQQPTQEPSQQPTQEPSEEPTQQPSEEPTQQPSEEPTQQPSEEPTQQPSEEPTQQPSSTPPSGSTSSPSPTTSP